MSDALGLLFLVGAVAVFGIPVLATVVNIGLTLVYLIVGGIGRLFRR